MRGYLEEVERDMEQLRSEVFRARDEKKAEILEKIPEIETVERDLQAAGLRLARLAMTGNDYESVRQDIQSLQERRRRLLKANGYSEKDLEPNYRCATCKDEGRVDGRMCSCMKNRLVDKAYDRSSIANLLRRQHFGVFDKSLFRGNRKADEPISPRELMEYLAIDAKRYAENFTAKGAANLMYYGPVGTGKTFLCSCIAKEILDRGFSVLYQSAPTLIGKISEYNFAPFDEKKLYKDAVELIYDVDLLIIDDLGAEFATSMNASYLFEILNERLIDDKAVILSTNLEPTELARVYDNRIRSRILGGFEIQHVFGDDLRMKKLSE